VLVVPNPFSEHSVPVMLQYQYGNFAYFYILMASASLAYSWKTMFAVVWYTTVCWFVGYYWAINRDDPYPELTESVRTALADYPDFLEVVDPYRLPLHMQIEHVLIFAIVGCILSLNNWRSNRLLERQADAARERANLARYFAPTIVDHLAGRDKPLGEVRSQPVVVMFIDIVGFTKMAEQNTPETIVGVLREFHGRMETAVFDNHGTLDKFLGDGIMATFGTPVAGDDDAINSLKCAVDMQNSMKDWNEVRVAQGKEVIRLSIGLHAGDVVLGDIGSERRLEFAVLGDVVNVSSRLEALTREIGVHTIASEAVIEAAGGESIAVQYGLKFHGPADLRGRDEPVTIWKC
jgi:adenylate cyclase